MSIVAQTNSKLNSFYKINSNPNLIFTIKNSVKNYGREFLVEYLSDIDQEFFESKVWKKDFIDHGFRTRTLITSIGEVTFKRRYYVARTKGKYANFAFVDAYLDVLAIIDYIDYNIIDKHKSFS